jgi:hypothetical protein
LLRIEGPVFGGSFDDAGDVDADGYPDVVAGYPAEHGSAFVFSGYDGHTVHRFDGETGWDGFGTAVCGVGDVDEDGHADVAVSAPRTLDFLADKRRPGYVRVFSGRTGEVLREVRANTAGIDFGALVDSGAECSKSLVVTTREYGRPSRASVFALPSGTERFTVESEDTIWSCRAAGDFNGDDVPDFLLGLPHPPRLQGLSGCAGEVVHSIPGGPGSMAMCFSPTGDVDGDGRDDILYVGSDGVVVASGASGTELRRVEPVEGMDATDVDGGPDLDGDGVSDFLVVWNRYGHRGERDPELWRAGFVRVYSGADGRRILEISRDSLD